MAQNILITHFSNKKTHNSALKNDFSNQLTNACWQHTNNSAEFLKILENSETQIAIIEYDRSLLSDPIINRVFNNFAQCPPIIFIINEQLEEEIFHYLSLGLYDYIFTSNLNRLVLSIHTAAHCFSLDEKQHSVTEDIVADLPGCVFQLTKSPNGIYRFLFNTDTSDGLLEIPRSYNRMDFQHLIRIIPPEQQHAFKSSIDESATSLNTWQHQFSVQLKNGTICWLKGSANPRQYSNGEVIWHGVMLDVTNEPFATELKTETSSLDKQRKAAFDSTIEAIITIDEHGIIQTCNPAASKIFAYNHTELIGSNISILIPEPDKSLHNSYIKNYLTSNESKIIGKARSIKCISKNGRIFPAQLRVSEYKIGDDSMFVGFIQDMTDLAQTVKALNTSKRNLKKQKLLLELTHNALANYVKNKPLNIITNQLLAGLLEITNSQLGIIGEIVKKDHGNQYLRVHGLKNKKWSKDKQSQFDKNIEKGLSITNTNALLNITHQDGLRICSHKSNDQDEHLEIPYDEIDWMNYLSIPVYYGDQLVGMYALGNKKGGYDKDILDYLEPVNTAFGTIINSSRMQKKQNEFKRELIVAKDVADRANMAKSQFLAKMSHELKTPLNAILGYAQILEINNPDIAASEHENIFEITKAGKHLLTLINDILDLSKIEAGKTKINIEEFSLLELIKDCVNISSHLVVENNVKLEINILEDIVLQNDLTKVKQILLNLLSNAIKYNRDNGTVQLAASIIENKVRVSVTDTGYGIAEEYQQSIYTEFNRLGFENSDVEGTGIGLQISQQLTQLLQGEIGCQSQKDVGSTFWIELPLKIINQET